MRRSEGQVTRRQCLELMAGAAGATLTPALGLAESVQHPMRMAISADTLGGANLNDARAAYRVWVAEVSRQFPSTLAEIAPEVFLPSDELILDVRRGNLEGFGVTALEYARLADLIDPEVLILQDYLADGMEYLLLVHNSSPFKKLADLRGTQVLMHLHRDMVLAPAWLNTLLAANNLPRPERFFAHQITFDNLNQVVLPVFFHRADAACLAQRNWETMLELNPQLGRDLRPLAVSPKVIPIAIGFRRNCSAAARKVLIDSIMRVSSVAAGQQIIALYQSHGFVTRPTSVMKGTLEMIRQSERISTPSVGARKGNS